MIVKTADTLERGDIIHIGPGSSRTRWVVVESSDQVDTLPQDAVLIFGKREMLAKDCCEPRIAKLGRTGRVTHEITYVIWPSGRRMRVREFLDLDIRSAVPEPIKEEAI